MKADSAIYIAGVVLLMAGLVLHIVCLATPYYSEANLHGFIERIVQAINNNPDVSQQLSTSQQQAIGDVDAALNFGMWQLCFDISQATAEIDLCFKWGQISSVPNWMRAVQAMAILGMIAQAFVTLAAVVNLVSKSKGDRLRFQGLFILSKSKGDRLRFLDLFIISLCGLSAAFILIGDTIMATKHSRVLDPLMEDGAELAPDSLMFHRDFNLYWGFGLDIVSAVFTLFGGIAHLIGSRIASSTSGLV